MMQNRRFAFLRAAPYLVAATVALTLVPVSSGAPTNGPPTDVTVPGLDVAGIDRTVAPGDDFFRFANGAWLKATEIPADRGSWGPAEQLAELTDKRNAELIRNVGKTAPPGSEARKIGDYYASFMDEAAIERLQLKPLEGGMRSIE